MNSYANEFLQHDWILPERLLEDMDTSIPTSSPQDSANEGVNGDGGGNVNTDNDSLLDEKEGVMAGGLLWLVVRYLLLTFSLLYTFSPHTHH